MCQSPHLIHIDDRVTSRAMVGKGDDDDDEMRAHFLER